MNFLSGLELDNFDNIPRKEYTGKEVFSYLIPKKINMLKGDPANPKIFVKNGIVEAGLLGEDALGVKKNKDINVNLNGFANVKSGFISTTLPIKYSTTIKEYFGIK
jgi:hypothetical protein